jgi:hypothetical protein
MAYDDIPTYRPGGLQRPDTSFASPSFTQAEYALDANHEAAKQWQPQHVQAGPIETQRADFGQSDQGDQRGRERPEADEPYEPEAAQDEPYEPEAAPARLTGRVFGGRDVAENMTGTRPAGEPVSSLPSRLPNAPSAAGPARRATSSAWSVPRTRSSSAMCPRHAVSWHAPGAHRGS